MIREDSTLIFAKVKAAIYGFGGTFVEAHQLDASTARKVPRKMIGRALTADEAAALLDRRRGRWRAPRGWRLVG